MTGARLSGAVASVVLLLAACRPAAAGPASNRVAALSLDELVFRAQRYGSTDEKRAEKAEAHGELLRRGPAALQHVMPLTAADSVMVWGLAQELVSALSTNGAPEILAGFLSASQPRVRRSAAYFLGLCPDPGLADRVTPLLDDDEAAGAAIRTLGKWRVRSSVPRIEAFLKHDKEVRRVAAANGLRDVGDPRASAALIEALDDPYFTVRRTAARALVSLGPEAHDAMTGALRTADGRRLRELIAALGETDSRRAARELGRLRTHPDALVRADAADAIRAIEQRRAGR